MAMTRIRKVAITTVYYEVAVSSYSREEYFEKDIRLTTAFQVGESETKVLEPYRELTEAKKTICSKPVSQRNS